MLSNLMFSFWVQPKISHAFAISSHPWVHTYSWAPVQVRREGWLLNYSLHPNTLQFWPVKYVSKLMSYATHSGTLGKLIITLYNLITEVYEKVTSKVCSLIIKVWKIYWTSKVWAWDDFCLNWHLINKTHNHKGKYSQTQKPYRFKLYFFLRKELNKGRQKKILWKLFLNVLCVTWIFW